MAEISLSRHSGEGRNPLVSKAVNYPVESRAMWKNGPRINSASSFDKLRTDGSGMTSVVLGKGA